VHGLLEVQVNQRASYQGSGAISLDGELQPKAVSGRMSLEAASTLLTSPTRMPSPHNHAHCFGYLLLGGAKKRSCE